MSPDLPGGGDFTVATTDNTTTTGEKA